MEEENVSVKAIHQNDEVLEFNITCYNFKELCASAFELIKRSLMFIILILINLRVLYSALPFLLYCLLYFTIPTPFYLVFRLYIIILIFCWVFVMIAGGLYLRRYTKDLTVKINNGCMILSSKKHYNEIDIKNIKIKEKKKGIILIFKSVTNQKTNKISNFIKKYIIWYDCIPLLESNFTKDEIENIKYLIKQKEYAFMNRNITSVKAMHQNGEVLEFNINYYRFKELYTSAFELIKKSLIFIILVLINLPFMYFTLLLLLYFLLFFSMPIQPFHIFSVIILLFSWTCIIFIGEFHLRKYTKGLSIKIKDGYMILSSKQRYDVIDINKIKIKEKKNGIVLIFKRATNQKISMLSNFIKKINIWYDCIPLLESNFTKEEMEIIKYVINRKGDQL